MNSHIWRVLAIAATVSLSGMAAAAEVKVLTAGAFKQVVLALVPDFETQTGNKVVVDNDTAGGLKKRIESGEAFDVAVITPVIVDDLAGAGKIAPGSRVNLATVGVGVVVKEGAPKPDVSTVEAFRSALLAAKSVAYIDPASGGSSGIYIDKLLERLGIADQVRPEGETQEGRPRRRAHCQWRSRTWPAPDQRNCTSERRRARWAVAEGNPEHHDLCCRLERFQPKQGRGTGIDQDVLRTHRRHGA